MAKKHATIDDLAGMVKYGFDGVDKEKHLVYRGEFEDALARISALEKRVGVKSGKTH